MNTKQHTLANEISLQGKGLHTGAQTQITFKPADANHGIVFQRVDLEDQPLIAADVDNVVDTSRSTTIGVGDATVSTIEHALAALAGLQVDNVLIEIDGPEVPILDGSAIEYVQAIRKAGLVEQDADREIFEIPKGVFFKDEENNIEIAALPMDDYRLTVMVDYNSPVLGSQHAMLYNLDKFEKEIADSRTFCFLHEVEMLFKNDLIKGGDLDNAVVIVDRTLSDQELEDLATLIGRPKIEVKKEGILNNTDLRHDNEPARHKLLDLLGDLALIGTPIKAQILAGRPGHKANVEFAKKVKKMIKKAKQSKVPKYDPNAAPVYDVNQIAGMLPHRYPFLLVDKIVHLDDTSVVGVKNVTMNEPFFQGHFPGNPVMPGVLQIEAMAQNGGLLAMGTVDNPEDYWTYFTGIEKTKFRKMVIPGDTLIIKCELLEPIRRGIAKMKGTAYVGDKLVCESIMTAALVKKNK